MEYIEICISTMTVLATSITMTSYFQSPLSNEARLILSMDPSERTPDQLHTAVLALQTAVDAFSEFPMKMQTSLVRVGWYEQ